MHPSSFFSRLPQEEGLNAALVYYLIIGIVAAGVNLFWSSVFHTAGLSSMLMPDVGTNSMSSVIEFLLSPLTLMVTLLVVTGICHLFLKIAGGANHGFERSMLVFSYAYGPALLGVIPFLGNLVGFVWMIVLAIVGLREAHKTTTGKAAAAVLIPTFLLSILLIIVVTITAMTGFLGTHL